jgi:dimethylamine---corrinoid protein Co-methyltransferase
VGVGDVLGMAATHAIASGMGGMRTAGDLVARMQMSRGMRIRQAKEYVAGRLKIGVRDLSDPLIMSEVREDLKLGLVNPPPNYAVGIETKFHIERLLGIEIRGLRRFKEKAGL